MRWLKEVFLNFKRSGFMSAISIGTIVITIIMLGGYYILTEGLGNFVERIENKLEIVAFLKDSTPDDSVENMITEAKAMGNVSSVKFISKEDAYQDFIKDDEMRAIMSSFEKNPLPDSIIIKLKEYTGEDIDYVVNFFRDKDGVEEVQYGGGQIENLINIINVVKTIAAAAGIIFIIASVLVVSNIIKLTIVPTIIIFPPNIAIFTVNLFHYYLSLYIPSKYPF